RPGHGARSRGPPHQGDRTTSPRTPRLPVEGDCRTAGRGDCVSYGSGGSMMVRITPDDVVQAYADTYLRPLMDGYYKPRKALASALVAVAIQQVGRYAYLNLRTLIGDID